MARSDGREPRGDCRGARYIYIIFLGPPKGATGGVQPSSESPVSLPDPHPLFLSNQNWTPKSRYTWVLSSAQRVLFLPRTPPSLSLQPNLDPPNRVIDGVWQSCFLPRRIAPTDPFSPFLSDQNWTGVVTILLADRIRSGVDFEKSFPDFFHFFSPARDSICWGVVEGWSQPPPNRSNSVGGRF